VDVRTHPHVREAATLVVTTDDGEQPRLHLLLSELPGGVWQVFLLELPWGVHETGNEFDSAEEACKVVDKIYAMCVDAGVWRVRRWGWKRPDRRTGEDDTEQ
jgi:hypothetical protein